MAKTEILDSIRQNLAASLPFDEIHAEHLAHKEKETFSESIKTFPNNENLAEFFRENLLAIGANCETAANLDEAKRAIEEIIEIKNARKIAVSDATSVVEISRSLTVEIVRNASKNELFECDLGITSAQFGIAETGTLVIETDKEFNRLTSLIPPVHICILEASKIRRTLGEILAELQKDLSRSIAFITGQSRTSDIELTLALGVHGPGELFVFIVEE